MRIKCCFGKKVREYFAYPRGKVLVSMQEENKTEHLGRKIQYGRKTSCYKNSWVVIGYVVVLVCLYVCVLVCIGCGSVFLRACLRLCLVCLC